MSSNDRHEEQYIEQQLEALEEEREAIEEQFEAGMISEKESKVLLAKNAYLKAQIIERNKASFDKTQEQSFERKRDVFND